MNKFLFLLCVSLFLFSCKKESDSGKLKSDSDKLKIVVANFPLYDFAREIGGDFVSITMLFASDHSYEPSPQDMIAIQNANIFIYIGGESDEWVKKILNTTLNSKLSTLYFLENEESEDHHEEDHEEDNDEHIWTSPRNAIDMAKKIAEAFSEKDTLNKDFYMERNAKFTKNLEALDSMFTSIVENSKRKTIIFGDRFPFKHFAEDYGLEYHAAFPGCSNETEPSAASVAFLIDKVKAEKIPVVFHIELSNESIANTITEATGAKKMLMHSVHNVSDLNESYLSLMKKNAEALKEAL